jgi:hypothetical protein
MNETLPHRGHYGACCDLSSSVSKSVAVLLLLLIMDVIENIQRYYDRYSVLLQICTVAVVVRVMCRNFRIFRLGKKIGITFKSIQVNFYFII